jgi:hypothetical protein
MRENKYLTKIAENQEKSEGVGKRVGKALLSGTLLGPVAAGTPVAYLANRAGHHLLNTEMNAKGNADLGTVKKFMKDNKLHNKVTFNNREHSLHKSKMPLMDRLRVQATEYHGFAAYHPNHSGGKAHITGVRGKNKDVLMHELGHAKDFNSHSSVKRVGMHIARHPHSHAAFGAAGALMLSNDKTRDYAPLASAVPGALMLREEAAANYHAFKGIKAHKGAHAGNKFLKGMARKNMINYGLSAAAPVAGMYAAKKIMDAWSPRKTKG